MQEVLAEVASFPLPALLIAILLASTPRKHLTFSCHPKLRVVTANHSFLEFSRLFAITVT